MIKKNGGITLIALVITIIVLLILAAISISTLTGENGVLTKASTAEKETDIKETKEQIKLEIMGTYDENKTDYTNTDVINAVKKIVGEEITENKETVKSKKGNDVDISDLWKKKWKIYAEMEDEDHMIECEEGNTWNEELINRYLDVNGMREVGVSCNNEHPITFAQSGVVWALTLNGEPVDLGDPLVNGAVYESVEI